MEATTSAVGAIARDIDFWIKIVSVFSTAFAVFIAVVAIIFAVLTFSQYEQKKKAEKELVALAKIRKDSEILHGIIKKLADQARQEIQEINKITDKITKKAKLSAKELKELEEKKVSLDRTLNSLATISSMSPSTSPSASKHSFSEGLRSATKPLQASPKPISPIGEFSMEDIEAAMKALDSKLDKLKRIK